MKYFHNQSSQWLHGNCGTAVTILPMYFAIKVEIKVFSEADLFF